MKDYLDDVSHDYHKALEDAKKFHATTDKFSGKFLRPHAKYIKSIIDKFDIKSILDYGCGKGLQYTWVIPNAKIEQWDDGDGEPIPHGQTMEQYWGIEVTKFDPAVPAFSKEPAKAHDLVICSHVLGTIPVKDLPVIVKRIFSLTNKFLYAVEAIGPSKKNWLKGEVETPRFTPIEWIDAIAPHKPEEVECELVVRYRSDLGSHLGRFRL